MAELRSSSECDNDPDRPDAEILLAAIQSTGEAIIVTSADLDEPGPRIEFVNPAFVAMTGYTAREILGQTPRVLQGSLTSRAVLAEMRAKLQAEERFQGETVNYRKDGSTYVVEWLIAPIRSRDGIISHWVSTQRDVTERHAAEDRQKLLVRELHHRVKNTLATVQAILNATARSATGLSEFRQSFAARIASMAKTHALITDTNSQSASFEQLVRTELRAYEEPGRGKFHLEGPEVYLPSELAVPVGMAVHELATNAVRHGALADSDGRLEVTWTVQESPTGRVLHWTWDEHDGPPVGLPTREGFGSQLLKKVLTHQIGAKVEIAYDPDGLRVHVAIPLRSKPFPLATF